MTKFITLMTHAEADSVAELIKDDFMALCQTCQEDNRVWTAPMYDLIELLHEMWARDYVLDSVGRRQTFGRFALDMCRRLHVAPPKNVFSVLSNISVRKNGYNRRIFPRLHFIIHHEADHHPLNRFWQQGEGGRNREEGFSIPSQPPLSKGRRTFKR